MRLPLFATLTLLTACSATPRPTPEVMPEVAAEFVALYNSDWDEPRFSAMFATNNPERVPMIREHLAWLREQLGTCGEPRYMWSTGNRSARWTHACERGALETAFELDASGQIVDMSSGAVDVPPPPDLLAAATTIIASLPWAPGERPFKHNLTDGFAQRMGTCSLVRPWVFARRTGTFHVLCDKGNTAVFTVGLSPEGTITRANLFAGSGYKAPL